MIYWYDKHDNNNADLVTYTNTVVGKAALLKIVVSIKFAVIKTVIFNIKKCLKKLNVINLVYYNGNISRKIGNCCCIMLRL